MQPCFKCLEFKVYRSSSVSSNHCFKLVIIKVWKFQWLVLADNYSFPSIWEYLFFFSTMPATQGKQKICLQWNLRLGTLALDHNPHTAYASEPIQTIHPLLQHQSPSNHQVDRLQTHELVVQQPIYGLFHDGAWIPRTRIKASGVNTDQVFTYLTVKLSQSL